MGQGDEYLLGPLYCLAYTELSPKNPRPKKSSCFSDQKKREKSEGDMKGWDRFIKRVGSQIVKWQLELPECMEDFL